MKTFLIALLIFTASFTYASPIVISGSSDNDIIGRTCRMPNGNLISIVERNPDWGSGDLYATFSTDDGDTWSTLTPVITDAGNQSTFSLVVSSNDSLVLFYASDETGYYKIFSIKSIDGVTWVNKQQINLGWSSTQQVYDPMVIVEEDNSLTMVYIAMGGGAYIANCPYEGVWDINKTLIQSGAYRVRICKNESTYLVAYHRNISGNYDVHTKTSVDRINWSSEINVTSNGNSHDAYCNVTPDGKYMLFYAKYTPSDYNIHRQFSDDGISWYGEESITMDDVNNTQPSFFIDGTTVYLTWTHAIDYDTDNDIYLEKFDYLTSFNNDIENIEPQIYFDNISAKLIIENIPYNLKSTLVITDVLGRVYFSKEIQSNSQTAIINDLAFLRKGMYIACLYVENRKISLEFVVNY